MGGGRVRAAVAVLVIGIAPLPARAAMPATDKPTRTVRGSLVNVATLPDLLPSAGVVPRPGRASEPSGAQPASDAPLDADPEAMQWPPAAGADLEAASYTGWIPPDAAAAIGPNHMLSAHNGGIFIRNRAGVLLKAISLHSMWARTLSRNETTPRAYYDRARDRWLMTMAADAYDPAWASLGFAVSRTGDPAGEWSAFAFGVNFPIFGNTDLWAEWPTLGVAEDFIAISGNLFDMDGNFDHTLIFGIRASDIYNDDGGLTAVYNDLPSSNGANWIASLPASPTNSIHLAQVLNASSGTLRLGVMTEWDDFDLGPTVSGGAGWSASGSANMLPQLGTSTGLDPADGRVSSLTYRDGSLWAAHTVFLPAGAPTRAAAQWWQIAPSGFVAQRSRIEDSTGTIDYAFPSIAVNRDRDVVIAYGRYTSGSYAGSGYAFRYGWMPPNVAHKRGVLNTGVAKYVRTFNQINLWGRYTTTLVDPLNEWEFWSVQLTTNTRDGLLGDRWGARWLQVRIPPEPHASISPSSLAFELTAVGRTSDARTVTIGSHGNVPATITSVGFTGPNAGDFTITRDACTLQRVPVNGSCTLDVAMAPDAEGARTATLVVTSDAVEAPLQVALSGEALDDTIAPVTTLDPAPLVSSTGISGTTTDDYGGVASVTVEFTEGVLVVTVSPTLSCTPDRRSCTWRAAPPFPGSYDVRARGTDVVRNVENPGAEASYVDVSCVPLFACPG